MEVHRQTCQECGGRNMKNILFREPGEPEKVFVQCRDCSKLVARYIMAQQGYYHHGKGFESYLRGLNRGGFYSSGKDMTEQFNSTKENCLRVFEKALAQLKKENKE